MAIIGQILAILASICGAVASIRYNQLGKQADSDVMAYLRMCIAVPVMLLYSLLADGFIIPSIPINTTLALIVSGIIGFFVTDLFMFRAYVSWGARETMVVMCLAPVLSALLAFLIFGETMTALQILGSSLSIVGIIIMVAGDNQGAKAALTSGALYALLAACLQSIADMSAKGALDTMPWVTASAVRAVGGIAAWIIFGAIKGKAFFKNAKVFGKPKAFAGLFITVLIGTALGTTCAMGALNFAPAGIVTSLKQISPLFILPYEVIFTKKRLTAASVLGTVISVAGVFLIFF